MRITVSFICIPDLLRLDVHNAEKQSENDNANTKLTLVYQRIQTNRNVSKKQNVQKTHKIIEMIHAQDPTVSQQPPSEEFRWLLSAAASPPLHEDFGEAIEVGGLQGRATFGDFDEEEALVGGRLRIVIGWDGPSLDPKNATRHQGNLHIAQRFIAGEAAATT